MAPVNSYLEYSTVHFSDGTDIFFKVFLSFVLKRDAIEHRDSIGNCLLLHRAYPHLNYYNLEIPKEGTSIITGLPNRQVASMVARTQEAIQRKSGAVPAWL